MGYFVFTVLKKNKFGVILLACANLSFYQFGSWVEFVFIVLKNHILAKFINLVCGLKIEVCYNMYLFWNIFFFGKKKWLQAKISITDWIITFFFKLLYEISRGTRILVMFICNTEIACCHQTVTKYFALNQTESCGQVVKFLPYNMYNLWLVSCSYLLSMKLLSNIFCLSSSMKFDPVQYCTCSVLTANLTWCCPQEI